MEIISYEFLYRILCATEGKQLDDIYIMSTNWKSKLPCLKELKVDLWFRKRIEKVIVFYKQNSSIRDV